MLRRAGLLVALTALLVPAVAGTTANAKTRAPVVTRITPKHVYVGETLTIRGHHFRRGLNKNTVAFKRSGAKVVFVKAEKGTTKMLKVTLPKRLERVLVVKNGTATPTRLKVRVLSSRFGKRFTSRAKSPVVGPEKPPAPPKPADVDPNADCDGDHIVNRIDTDDDNDLLSDTLERSLGLDECNVDSDRDGVEDGYEYQSAKDLNDDEDQEPNQYLPYPTKKPYPNPLDGTDADTDHDGDTLSLMDEYKLWKYTIAHGAARTLTPLTYSAGEQFSVNARGNDGRRTPSLAAAGYAKQAQFLSWAGSHGYANVMLSPLGNTAVGNYSVPEWWERPHLVRHPRHGSLGCRQRRGEQVLRRRQRPAGRRRARRGRRRPRQPVGGQRLHERPEVLERRLHQGDQVLPHLRPAPTWWTGTPTGTGSSTAPTTRTTTTSRTSWSAAAAWRSATSRYDAPDYDPVDRSGAAVEGHGQPVQPVPAAPEVADLQAVRRGRRLGGAVGTVQRERGRQLLPDPQLALRAPDTLSTEARHTAGLGRFWESPAQGTAPTAGGAQMADSVYRVTEVIGVSSESWEAAARNAVETAAKTVRDLRVAEVVREDVTIENGAISNFRVRLAISFKYDSGD